MRSSRLDEPLTYKGIPLIVEPMLPLGNEPGDQKMSDITTKPEIQMPTPGRIVYLWNRHRSCEEELFPTPVGVIRVEGDLVIVAEMGKHGYEEMAVEHISAVPNTNMESSLSVGWDWCACEKELVENLRRVQRRDEWLDGVRKTGNILGLRKRPTDAELNNRFTYHPPKEGQPAKYTEIRASAKDFACTLSDLCPPSAELARAFELIDQAVFSANASIARHG